MLAMLAHLKEKKKKLKPDINQKKPFLCQRSSNRAGNTKNHSPYLEKGRYSKKPVRVARATCLRIELSKLFHISPEVYQRLLAS